MLRGYSDARHQVRESVLNTLQGLAAVNKEGLEALKNKDASSLESVRSKLSDITQMTEKIDNDIVLIFAKYAPEARDLRELISYLKITSTFNRIHTNINNYLKNMQSMLLEDNKNIIELIENSLVINKCTVNAFDYTLKMFETFDDNDKIKMLVSKIDVEYSKTDDMYTLLEKMLLGKYVVYKD